MTLVVQKHGLYLLHRHTHDTVGRLVDRYEELLLTSVHLDGDWTTTIGISKSVACVLAVVLPRSPLGEGLLDLLACDRLIVEIELVVRGLRLLHGEELDRPFLVLTLRVGSEREQSAEFLRVSVHEVSHLSVGELHSHRRVLHDSFLGDTVLFLQVIPIDLVQSVQDIGW